MEWYFTFQWGVVFQMRGFIFKGGCPMGGSINFDWGGGFEKSCWMGGGGGVPPTMGNPAFIHGEDLCHQL